MSSPWLKRIGVVAGAGLGLSICAAVVVNLFFFEATTTYLIDAAVDESGIEVSSGEVSGSLLAGRITMTDVRLSREGHESTDFEIQAERLHLDVNLWSLFTRTRRVKLVEAVGLNGQVNRLAEVSDERDDFDRLKGRIELLQLEDIELIFVDHVDRESPEELFLQIDHLRTSPLRSRSLGIDFFLSTETSGTVADGSFELSHRLDHDGVMVSTWHFEELPAAAAGRFIGGPLGWIEEGRIDINVEYRRDAAVVESRHNIESDWTVILRDIEVARGLNPVQYGFSRFVRSHGDEIVIEFSIELDDQAFSGNASALWKAVIEGIIGSVGEDTAERGLDSLFPTR